MKIREEYTCPLELMSDMLAGKWKNIILWKLRENKQGLGELARSIKGISEKMLLQHLNELIDCKMVQKKTFEGYPLKVEYSLTSVGEEVIKGVEIFQKIAIDYYQEFFPEADDSEN